MFEPLAAAMLVCLSPVAIDGDTVKCAATNVRIRLFGVQAPERGQAGYVESTKNLQRILEGGVVCYPTGGASYNRIVAQCYNSFKIDAGYFQIHEGHAKEWCSYSKNVYLTCPVAKRR